MQGSGCESPNGYRVAIMDRWGEDLGEARGHGNDTRLCRRKTASPVACCPAPRAVLESSAARDRRSLARFFGRSDIAAPSDFSIHRQMVATDPGWFLRCQTD